MGQLLYVRPSNVEFLMKPDSVLCKRSLSAASYSSSQMLFSPLRSLSEQADDKKIRTAGKIGCSVIEMHTTNVKD